MHLLCKVSSAFSDVQCPVCGQGFLVYWTRQHAGEREAQRPILGEALRSQHALTDTAEAHAPAFQLAPTLVPVRQRQRSSRAATSTIPVYS